MFYENNCPKLLNDITLLVCKFVISFYLFIHFIHLIIRAFKNICNHGIKYERKEI
jgi:hypothetical protein